MSAVTDVELSSCVAGQGMGRGRRSFHAIPQAQAIRRAAAAQMSISARLQNVAGSASANRGRVVA